MSIQLITFDLDDTLWSVRPVIAQADRQLLAWLAEHAPHLGATDTTWLEKLRCQVLKQSPHLQDLVSELRVQMLQLACLQAGDSPARARETAEAAFQVFLTARQQVKLFADAIPMLEQLSSHFILGALSNGNADIRRIGLARYFSFALSADALGVAKPEPAGFRAALARAGVSANQALHIGDNPRDDIFGAQRVGMHSLWFNPQGKNWSGGQAPDAQVQSLAQIPATIAQLIREQ